MPEMLSRRLRVALVTALSAAPRSSMLGDGAGGGGQCRGSTRPIELCDLWDAAWPPPLLLQWVAGGVHCPAPSRRRASWLIGFRTHHSRLLMLLPLMMMMMMMATCVTTVKLASISDFITVLWWRRKRVGPHAAKQRQRSKILTLSLTRCEKTINDNRNPSSNNVSLKSMASSTKPDVHNI